MNILGISAFYHDSAAALVMNGEIVSAAQEERFSREKHDSGFPKQAINYVLKEGGISIGDIDCVAFYDNTFLKFQRILSCYLAYAPSGVKTFIEVMPLWLRKKIWIPSLIRKKLGYQGRIISLKHHQSHAASAFFPSPFRRAAFLTVDGVGEWETTTFGTGYDNKLEFRGRITFPHSLGLLYSVFTYFTGFKVNSGEYKVMGLAPYGEPKYVEKILTELIDVKEDGSFRMNMDYFDYAVGVKMITERFEKLFGRPPRKRDSLLTQNDMDLARSIQDVVELVMLKMARHIRKTTGEKYLCLAGGVALNCVANSKVLRSNLFDDIWIQPASGDAGGALGAAFYTWYEILNNKREADNKTDKQKGSYLGPAFDNDDIKDFLEYHEIPYEYHENIEEVAAELLSKGKIIGWFSGRMEYGPRALGSRSIIGDPRVADMQKTMNMKIKYRESFRPFAPSVLEEEVENWFETDRPSPYMLLIADVKSEKRKPMTDYQKKLFGIEKLNIARSEIPAVTHVDYSARIQTVSEKNNEKFYNLIRRFFDTTGCPVIINTSFNVRGEPIVCTPEEAYRCFMRTEIDYLVLENFLLDKEKQGDWEESDDWKREFELD